MGEFVGTGKDRVRETIEDGEIQAMIEDARDGVAKAVDRGKKSLQKS